MQRAHSLCDLVIRDERLRLIHSNHCFPLSLRMSRSMSPPLSCCREAVTHKGSSIQAWHGSIGPHVELQALNYNLWDGAYLCELAFEANEVDLGGVSPKVAGDVEVYAVHAAELWNPASHLNISYSACVQAVTAGASAIEFVCRSEMNDVS